jgi:hypothetical protein
VEDVQVPGYEDPAIEGLCNEGDAFGALVSVDCEDEDTFGEGMGYISQDAEYLMRWSTFCILKCYTADYSRS